MIKIDVNTINGLFKDVQDMDSNGVLSGGDRIVTDHDTYTVTSNYEDDLYKMTTFLSNIGPRSFRILSDTSESASYNEDSNTYLAWSTKEDRHNLDSLLKIGSTNVSYSDDSYIYNVEDLTDASVSLNLGAMDYVGTNPTLVKKHSKWSSERLALIRDIRANWDQSYTQEKLFRLETLDAKLARISK